MRVIKRLALEQFWQEWPNAERPLRAWYGLTSKATWRNFAEVKVTFGQTDQARVKSGGMVAIFDIGGNKFRLIAAISFAKGKVYVLRILTHKEYDQEHWKRQL
ncbi:MAG: type II toxin-antitoxin system HigB family toxin [Burkholderiales bacterium]|nr:type II toxin-antitoxin system HigB family toxin [Phycisphaerae bacterium]